MTLHSMLMYIKPKPLIYLKLLLKCMFDASKLASSDGATWQIVVVAGCAVVAVAAFVAAVVEIISFAHFELAFET